MFELRRKKIRDAEVSCLVCRPLADAGFLHAFSTRTGGVSPLPKDALNLSYKHDRKENVDENRRRFLSTIGAEWPVITMHQTHSDAVLSIEARSFSEEPEGDALVTREKNVFVGVKTADCVPILIADPKTRAVAAVHAGWRGTLSRIAEKTVARLAKDFGADNKNLIAAIGPSACGDCYEVGEDLAEKFRKEFSRRKPAPLLDLPAVNVQQLLDAGLSPKNVHVAPHCTIHENHLFFSHRIEGKSDPNNVGRLLAVIGLKE